MKKAGIMRINSYNKFFAKVAKIMNTEVKSVKPIDGQYKVELANHVYLNVYRGVEGSLFIHDHRGISHITRCYDFEAFKTMKDLYERLVSDYSESAKKDVMEVRQESNSRLGIEKTSLPCLTCKHFCVRFDNERIKMTHCVRKNSENYLKAAKNPNWHHVSLRTLANIDNDMLDEKRRNYMYLYNLIKDFRKYAFEIIRKDVYFETARNVFRNIQQLYFNNVISFTTYDYAAKHIQAVGVEKRLFDSKSEETFGYKESRRYKVTLR